MPHHQLTKKHNLWIGRFEAMASPCEILIETEDRRTAAEVVELACIEALRIEHSFSRYRDDNQVHVINHSNGKSVTVDSEMQYLLDFAHECYTLSDGLFDITSGVLRRVWKFDGSDRIPTQAQIDTLLPLIGWDKATWNPPTFTLPAGMQIDLGGIGKEYAVDRTILLLKQLTDAPVLVNFGGDLHASKPRLGDHPWLIGIDTGLADHPTGSIRLHRGALTTSGSEHRYLQRAGVRYGHVLNPRTGWPAPDAPQAVTVASATCTEAGILSTLAMLQGANAESFLEAEQVHYWCYR